MPTALVLSSYVAATRIGGSVQQLVLAGAGLEPVLVPTSLHGRTPARGGQRIPVTPDSFARMLSEVEAEGALADASLAICGHFSDAGQVAPAAAAILRLPAQAVVVVDPVLGDEPKGLYVPQAVAEAVRAQLIARAHWITPNLFELGYLTGRELHTAEAAVAAARSLGVPALVTSAPSAAGSVSVLLVEAHRVLRLSHPRREGAPNGVGDLTTAAFGATLAQGCDPETAALQAVGFVASAVEAALEQAGADFPVSALMPAGGISRRFAVEIRSERL